MAATDTANTDQHFVPQMLLRGFAITGRPDQVWIFDKQSKRSFPTSIRNIAVERGYYDLDGSAALDAAMNEADNLTAPIIGDIRRRRSLSGITAGPRVALAGFTVLQMWRTRGFQEQVRHMEESLAAAVIDKGGFMPPGWRPDDPPDRAREEYLQLIPKFTRAFLPYLLDKDLLLFSADPSHPFCISDHPVTLNNTSNPGDGIRGTLGLGVLGIEVYLPISSELTLAYLCPSIGKQYERLRHHLRMLGGFVKEEVMYYLQSRDTGRAMMLGAENIRFQNSLQTLNAERFLISSVNDFADAMDIVEKHPNAKFGRRVVPM